MHAILLEEATPQTQGLTPFSSEISCTACVERSSPAKHQSRDQAHSGRNANGLPRVIMNIAISGLPHSLNLCGGGFLYAHHALLGLIQAGLHTGCRAGNLLPRLTCSDSHQFISICDYDLHVAHQFVPVRCCHLVHGKPPPKNSLTDKERVW
jgi:hypothetical protein